jgi:hypothetical protein
MGTSGVAIAVGPGCADGQFSKIDLRLDDVATTYLSGQQQAILGNG